MSVSQSLRTWLAANSPISTLVGTRIYSSVIPQNLTTLPAITYTQDSGEYIELLSGGRSDTRYARFSIECWDSTQLSARALADTITTELTGVRGAFGADTAESVRLENDFDGPPDIDEGRYRCSLRFEVAYY